MQWFNYLVSSFDTAIAKWISGFQSDALINLFAALSILGKWQVILLLSAGLSAFLILRHKKIEFIALWVSLVFTGVSVVILKEIFSRARPEDGIMYGDSLHSFPSGHAALSTVFYIFMSYLIYRHIQHKWLRFISIFFLITLVLTICFSRVYLQAHFATDVLAGMALGAVCLIAGVMLVRRYIQD